MAINVLLIVIAQEIIHAAANSLHHLVQQPFQHPISALQKDQLQQLHLLSMLP